MRVPVRFCYFLPIVVVAAPLLLPLAGCGGGQETSEPSAELKASEATYEEIIAKEKAAAKSAKGAAKKK